MTGSPPGHGAWVVPLALVAVHVALALLAFDPTPHTGGDNAAYISLGRSLLEHHAYLELWDPATPPHTLYPPVFPSILAAAMAVGIRPWVGLKLVVIAFSAGGVAFSYLWLKKHWGPRLALGVAAVLAVAPGVVELSHWILSDVPFWMLTMLALWGFERVEAGERAGMVVAVGATVLAYFTRSAGLPLVLAAASWLVLRRRWRGLAALAGVVLPLALVWWLRARAATGGVAYANEFWWVDPYRPELGRVGALDLLARMGANNGRYMLLHLPVLLFGRGGGWLGALGVVISLGAVAGWALKLRRPGPAELLLPLYIGLLYVWPAVWAGERFLLPALPLLLAYAAYALVTAAHRVKPVAAVWAGVGAVGLVMLLGLPAQAAAVRRGVACSTAYRLGAAYPCLAQPWRDFFSVATWTRENLPADAAVLSRKPRLFYALSGRRGRIYPKSAEPGELVRTAREAGARYIVLDYLGGQSYRYLIPALTGRPSAYCVLHSLGGDRVTIFGLLPGADTVADDESTDGRFERCPSNYRSSVPSR